jgi:DNA-binding transcriptional MocR family regulator
MALVQPSAIRELLKHGADPSIISFGGGYPDASLFPLIELSSAFQAALGTDGRDSLQYTVSSGMPRLREQVALRMAADGTPCAAENVLILQGGQQGLDLVAKMLIDPGDIIVTENPTFLGALIAFNPYQPRYAPVALDDEGMNMDALEKTLEQMPAVKLLYTVPDFQNPTGVTLSLTRRRRLLALASEFDFVVLEDTPYREIRYEGESLPTLKSLDTEGRVIHLGSFSKILAPGLRLGWAVASEYLTERLGLLKLAADTQCSTLNMAAVCAYLESNNLDAHITTLRHTYRRKKDLMLATIRETFPSCVSFSRPSGGLFTWLTFPADFDTSRFMTERALPIAKVAYVPGATFFPVAPELNHARISYSTPTDEAIVRGISSLGRLLSTTLSS